MTRQQIVILGGGFAGLYAAYVTGGTLISDAPVATAKKHASSYIFLHSDNRVQLLLQELGLPYVTKDLAIGYYCNNRTYERANSEMVSAYVSKAYPGVAGNLDQAISPNYFKRKLGVCNADYLALLEVLEYDVAGHTQIAKATRVDLKARMLYVNDDIGLSYDVLINTIPLASFIKLAGLERIRHSFDLSYMPLYFYESDHDMEEFQIVLDAEIDSPSLRWTAYDGKVVEEARMARDGQEPIAHLRFGKIAETVNTKIAKTIWFPTLEQMGVYMVGRFAQWQSHFDTEDAISRVTEIAVKILGGKT